MERQTKDKMNEVAISFYLTCSLRNVQVIFIFIDIQKFNI